MELHVEVDAPLEEIVESSPWDMGEWGTRVPLDGNEPEHLDESLVLVPEGVLHSLCCAKCGGYLETVWEMDESGLADQTLEGLQAQVVDSVFGKRRGSWLRNHRNCRERPKQHQVPEQMLEHTRRLQKLARERMSTGQEMAPGVIVCSRGRAPLLAEVPFVAEDQAELSVQNQAWLACIRHLVDEPYYALLIAEAWMDSGEDSLAKRPSECQKVLTLHQITPEVRRLGFAPIAREGGEPTVQRRIGQLTWVPGKPLEFTAGLLAPLVNLAEETASEAQRRGLCL